LEGAVLKVKICGIKSVEAARHAVESGADALGFVFAESKRKITPEDAKRIIEVLPRNIWKIGVFVNENPQTIKETALTIGLTHIQLHGEENHYDYEEIGLPLIKSASVASNEDVKMIDSLNVPYILLDSPPGKYKGGNGFTFDWNAVEGLGNSKANIILAGGLSPANVYEAIAKVNPFMVDVSSGVETDGEKDFAKIKEFIKRAKGIEEDLSI
jgi:phosphoribosylanthranilate isomerase